MSYTIKTETELEQTIHSSAKALLNDSNQSETCYTVKN